VNVRLIKVGTVLTLEQENEFDEIRRFKCASLGREQELSTLVIQLK